ncbi:hypothetical protein O7635_15780 [Asanoa sp. WMMD1127]|uniref:hypothetical protein n=1 Tax=Asanoa sp. WMMD1127 TaxID=3016107 RepID=UPI002415D4F0|nr:hypothetical protein [Asanoa sp. WMMD1127]MDG4823315.1 hypothetical protein [Asanoa sp. WMMD1127]
MSTTSARTPDASAADADRNWRLRHLPPILIAAAVMTVGAAVLGAVFAGGVGAFAAALGVLIATGSYLASTLAIAWADKLDSKLVMPFGMGVYVAKLSLLGGLMLVVASTGWAGLKPLSVGIVAGVLAWTATQIWWIVTVHARRFRR